MQGASVPPPGSVRSARMPGPDIDSTAPPAQEDASPHHAVGRGFLSAAALAREDRRSVDHLDLPDAITGFPDRSYDEGMKP